ncbi:MAG TPA: hypothetical protein VFA63_14990, partial [Pseudonocardiaceae bacterium]|nr:hypothetical protein [Pseudonocardiaceae bacterium]
LDPATSYDVRLTFLDSLGNTAFRTGSVTTQADFTGDPSVLVATHFVNPVTGLDTNNGTSSGTAWKTVDKAIAVANAGAMDMVIQFSAHSHKRSNTFVKPANGRKITLTGAADVVTLAGSPGDRIREVLPAGGTHTVVYSGFGAGPTGCPSGDLVANGGPVTAVAPWTQVTPDGNGAHVLWKWTSTGYPAYQPLEICYDSVVNGTSPKRLPQWKKITTDLDTVAKFANIIYDCQEQNFGFYNDPTGLSDIYVRMPGDANPNGFYFWIGGDPGVSPPKGAFQISGNDVRVCRIETRATDAVACLDGPAQRPIVDHNIAYCARGGAAYERWTSGGTGGYVVDGLYQYNRAQDSEMWKLDRTGTSWKFIKDVIHRISNGAQFSTSNRTGAASESTGIYGVKAGRRATIRYNTIVGHFNGVGTDNQSAPDRYSGYGRHVHHNLIKNGCDDGFEPEDNSMLWVVEYNRVEQMFSGFSTGPVRYGPIYFFANEFYRINSMGISDALTHAIYTAAFHKFSQNSDPAALCYVLYNTVYCDQVDGVGNAVSGGEKFASGASIAEATYWVGNILRFTKYCYDFPQASPAPGAAGSQLRHDDYNAWGTSDQSTTRGLSVAAGLAIGGSHHYLTIANYRTATGQGAHTNHFGGVDHDLLDPSWIDAALNDPTNGDVTLKGGSVFIDAGTPIDNFMDRAGVDYTGAAPDLGATQT